MEASGGSSMKLYMSISTHTRSVSHDSTAVWGQGTLVSVNVARSPCPCAQPLRELVSDR